MYFNFLTQIIIYRYLCKNIFKFLTTEFYLFEKEPELKKKKLGRQFRRRSTNSFIISAKCWKDLRYLYMMNANNFWQTKCTMHMHNLHM